MNTRAMQVEAHSAYTQWLSLEPWDLFLTMTDPGLSHPEAMFKRTRYAMNQINKSLYGKHFFRKGLGIEHVIGLERQKRGSVHSHTLIRLPHHNVHDINEFPLGHWHARINALGGFAKLELPNDSISTVDYVTKYVCKGGEIYLSENFDPLAPNTYKSTLFGAVH